MSAKDLLSLLRIQVTEGNSVEWVVSSEEEPEVQIPGKQRMSVEGTTLFQPPLAGQATTCSCHGLTSTLYARWPGPLIEVMPRDKQTCH